MNKIRLALLGMSALGLSFTFLGAAPAHAVGSLHPFCLQGRDSPGLSDCSYDSYGQCMATASGRFLYCVENPFFGGGRYDAYNYRSRRAPAAYHHPY